MSAETKICVTCGEEKAICDFYRKFKGSVSRRASCKKCSRVNLQNWQANNRQKTRDATNAWRAKNPEKVAATERKKNYGITQPEYENLLRKQGNRCAICQELFVESPHTDHAHGVKPIKVRGILCKDCNLGLGRFKDNPELLQSAMDYLLTNL